MTYVAHDVVWRVYEEGRQALREARAVDCSLRLLYYSELQPLAGDL